MPARKSRTRKVRGTRVRPGPRPRARPKRVKSSKGTGATRGLQQRLARLDATLKAERARHGRALAALQRAADRRLAAMMSEIAALRHPEARAEALARLLGERDTALAARAERIAELEALLRTPTQLG